MSKNKIAIIISELFHISLIGYLILLLSELLHEGFVGNVFNLNILLGIVVLLGVSSGALSLFKESAVLSKNQTRKPDLVIILAFAFMAGAIVYYKTSGNGVVSIFITSIAFVITSLLTYLVSKEGS